MARNGSGTYNLPAGNPVVTGTTISSTTTNNTFNDIATALTGSLSADGQTTPTGNLPMGGYKHTGVANATLRTQYASAGQVQDSATTLLTSVSGTNTIVATAALGMTAYATGQIFTFIPAANNTGAVTININAIGAKAITKGGSTALASGDIITSVPYQIFYDGTQFQLLQVSNSAAVTYVPAGTGAVTTTVQAKLRETVSVLDFGADPTGVADSTAAFNLATKSTYTSTGNFDQNFPGGVFVPAGKYLISGTIYVHKGQHLFGAGAGASKLDCSGMTSATVPVIKMGFSTTAEDAGALAPEVSGLFTYGGPTSYGIVQSSVAGALIYDMMITSPGIGIALSGGDTIVSNTIIDQGLNGITLSGQNNIISDVLFYNMNYGITVNSNTYDCQIDNCHFEYVQYSDIAFAASSTNIENVTVQGCQFVANVQYGTKVGFIDIRSAGGSIAIQDSQFRNGKGYAIQKAAGLGGTIRVSNCIFNGLKTASAYAQSSTAAGIDISFANFEVTGCQFINLYGNPIATSATNSYTSTIRNCTYSNITTATFFANVSATSGTLNIFNCQGDNVLPLVNLQSAMTIRLKDNINWLGAAQTASSRFYWNIPTQGGQLAQVSISANTNNAGNPAYRSTASYVASRNVNFDGTNVTDYAALTTAYSYAGTGYAGAIAPQIDLTSVGTGATATYSASGRYLVISVPNTYTAVNISADYLV
jgi:hypothetical protein